ncbi:hypothetical protein JL100_018845 [Skermanella mucosa]|uniref:hypothetical protein n=1 Tax=Skermanella mucosa TaxID=1789672 RepID=UPI00192BF348|nr:hypothetical protein [Skermanella mucosa]UEM19144.1 hypothetical protein JL100_018845 [Skermanella mucosa]
MSFAFRFGTLAAVLWGLAPNPTLAGDMQGIVLYEARGSFDQARHDLEDSIVNRGYVIDYKAKIGAMLQRTAGDVGSTRAIYADAETMQFCSALLSRKAMEADPGNIAYCPYVLFVYAPADAPGTSVVGFRRLGETGSESSRAALKEINSVLDGIAREAAGIE